MVTSVAVLDELSRGTLPHRDRAFAMARGVTILPYVPEILESIEVYVMRKVMPADPFGDAAHLAFASHYKCDFLLTWNCAHLANANKFGHIRAVNQLLGPSVPALVTPLELLFPPAA